MLSVGYHSILPMHLIQQINKQAKTQYNTVNQVNFH